MAQALTVTLPDAVYQHLQQIASMTKQPLEQLVRQSIEGNLPPAINNASPEIQQELLAMQSLAIKDLRQLAESQVAQEQQVRHLELLEKNATNQISASERNELAKLRLAADQLMLRKAYALALLRWRGYPLPDFEVLPVG
jgi:hypothetical protein